MKRIHFLFLSLLVLSTMSGFAAINVKIQGSIYSEISSRPGDLLRAGSRIKMFSELMRAGDSEVKIRMWGFNQKEGYLNRYDTGTYMRLDNFVDWAEVRLTGNILPTGPRATLAIGNVEIDYSPYIISLKDDGLSDYIGTYLHHRGFNLRDMTVAGFSISSFILWGFNDPLRNAIGGQISRRFGSIKLTGTIVDYRWRVNEVEKEILQKFQNETGLKTELAWQQVQSVELAQDLGVAGQCRFSIATQDENRFSRQTAGIFQTKGLNILREYEWKLPLDKDVAFSIVYREVPFDFDPYFRDRTPEFDPTTGHYLGYNPLDKYKGNKGLYAKVEGKKEQLDFEISVQQQTNINDISLRTQIMDVALRGQVGAWHFDTFSLFKNQKQWLDTNVSKISFEDFKRVILTKPLYYELFSLTPGFEWRQQPREKWGTIFVRYQGELLTIEAGVRQAFSEETTGGAYLGFKYSFPNGLVFDYRRSTIKNPEDGKKHYDPDYRLIEPDNLMALRIKVDF